MPAQPQLQVVIAFNTSLRYIAESNRVLEAGSSEEEIIAFLSKALSN
jgi:hypothetical protein